MVGVTLGLASSAWAQQTSPAAVRVVECNQQVQSHKRGICANQLSADDFRAIAPGVSWFYNWNYDSKDKPPAGVNVEFVPMVWGGDEKRLEGFTSFMAAGNKPRAVLALNEPNLKGQAFISPEESAKAYTAIKAVADRYHLAVIGPHLALGSAKDSSITAMDPIKKKQMTYTFMVPFLKAFLFYMGNTEVAATAYHTYGDMNELRWAVGMMDKEFNRPMWITEYAHWKTQSDEASRKFLIQSTDLLERSPHVQGYAWFKERVRDNAKISLFEAKSGKLTPLGETYVAMPVHDADLYYRLPGRLGIEIAAKDHVLATVTASQKDWQTLKTTVELPAGPQRLRVQLHQNSQAINWMKFTQK